MHNRTDKTYKTHKSNLLGLHTQDWRIYGRMIFFFIFAKFQRSRNAKINS